MFRNLAFVVALLGIFACTKGGSFKQGDCIVETGENPDTYLITQVNGDQLFGQRYINTEQENETVEIDRTETYKKVGCPDMKAPPPAVE